jgi:hypothetical protein
VLEFNSFDLKYSLRTAAQPVATAFQELIVCHKSYFITAFVDVLTPLLLKNFAVFHGIGAFSTELRQPIKAPILSQMNPFHSLA